MLIHVIGYRYVNLVLNGEWFNLGRIHTRQIIEYIERRVDPFEYWTRKLHRIFAATEHLNHINGIVNAQQLHTNLIGLSEILNWIHLIVFHLIHGRSVIDVIAARLIDVVDHGHKAFGAH